MTKWIKLIICSLMIIEIVPVFAAKREDQDLFEQLRAAQKSQIKPVNPIEIPESQLIPPPANPEQSLEPPAAPTPLIEPPSSVKKQEELPLKKTDTTQNTDRSVGIPIRVKTDDYTEKIKISGNTQFDIRQHQQSITDAESPLKNTVFAIRRARLELRGSIAPEITFKSSLELADKVSPKDIYIDVKRSDEISFRGGQFKYPFGNENIGSSRYLEFLETSMISNTLSGSRDRGILVKGNQSNLDLSYEFGVLAGTGNTTPKQNSGLDLAAHAEKLAFKNEQKNLFLWMGGSFATGTQQSSEKAKLEIVPETESGFNLFSAELPVDASYRRQRYEVDAKLVYGSIFVAVEYLNGDYTYSNKANINGGYLMASYFLTGEQRTIEDGMLERQHIINPFTSGGGWGAWEIAVRYSQFSVSGNFFEDDGLFEGWKSLDETENARQGKAITYGLNWYPEKPIRVMLNWVQTTADRLDNTTGTYFAFKSEKALLLRGQVNF